MWPLADQPEPRPPHGSATRLLRLTRPAFPRRSADRTITEPPDTDPYVRWCGRGGVVRRPPIPIAEVSGWSCEAGACKGCSRAEIHASLYFPCSLQGILPGLRWPA